MNETTEELFGDVSAPYRAMTGVTTGTGFGANPGLRYHGRIFAMLIDGSLVLKLPAPRVAALMAATAGVPFDAGKGRPMREWIVLAGNDDGQWRALIAEAFAFAVDG